MSSESLNVIALISGGKDSFFSLIHCIEHGHRIVALANLFPAPGTALVSDSSPSITRGQSPFRQEDATKAEPETNLQAPSHLTSPTGFQHIDPSTWAPLPSVSTGDYHDHDSLQHGQGSGKASDKDLNSFMYQTVGHEVLPLYAAATGLPLYRLPITGRAVRHERDYDATACVRGRDQDSDETESMLPLLQAIIARHPEANAVCAGAILSTYQRTRVESIALRLGLVPLAYLWQYPILPPPSAATSTDIQLLIDMANAGLEARIIKVASAGLDEDHLWERVSSETGSSRVKSALRKFGSTQGAAALGEGGEFETLVLDGPSSVFKKRIAVPEQGRKIVREGGGCSWLLLDGAQVEDKQDPAAKSTVRVPGLLDPRFKAVFADLPSCRDQLKPADTSTTTTKLAPLPRDAVSAVAGSELVRWSVFPDCNNSERPIQEETLQVIQKVRGLAAEAGIRLSQIISTIIVLRRMSDFPNVNGEYGKLFPKPNPPSRVTISCGDLLPAGVNIAIFLTAPAPQALWDRNGLHVQSRSYWAPANIGPYSQAIDVPVIAHGQATKFRCISIAGQIPLIPATMLLPSPFENSHELQIVLSLQHLWRIGQEMKIQWWTSSVAYFPRANSLGEIQHSAQLAGYAWKQAHGSPDDEEEADSGPDLWDLKYNPAYMSLGNDDKATQSIPSWDALTLRQQNEPETCIPPMFAAEVEELPRQAAVEWHAHNGLSRLEGASLVMVSLPNPGLPGWRTWHSIVTTTSATVVYSTAAYTYADKYQSASLNSLKADMRNTMQESFRQLRPHGPEAIHGKLFLLYADVAQVGSIWDNTGDNYQTALIPCRSIWSSDGQNVAIMGLFETVLT
ncbi:Meiotically up-regulated protein 71 protein [Fusarium austroafricanum]|uniref:Diphthine--ammonia ligase n=1 Tax=Fusarium austroafricanum TaxID=2364996 RepID=A0A8H4NSQ7_9HYPO|nr:Meiotically up-regulated protein 71 protein [Fusarium austroafricanum]